MDSEATSLSSSTLLPRRPREPRNHTASGRSRHRRARTAPQDRASSLRSQSSASLQSWDSSEGSSASSRSSQQGQKSYSCHIHCRVSPHHPGYFEYLRPHSVFRAPLKCSRSVPDCFSDSYKLQHPDLTRGQKTYLNHTAAVYSMSNMKALQERRYKQLLQHQVQIGFHTQEECDRYLKYLLGTRKHQYTPDSTVWRNPPKIPVRPKSFRLPPPTKSQPPRDYRFYPRGYGKAQEDAEEHGKDGAEGHGKDGAEEHGKDGAEEHGKDGAEEDGKDGAEEHGKDGAEEHGKDGAEEHGKDGAEEHGKDDAEDHGKDGAEEHGKNGAEEHGKDGAEEHGKDGPEEHGKDGPEEHGKDRAEEDQSLSESMQHMSFYYDPQLKRTVTHRQAGEHGAEEDGKDGAEEHGKDGPEEHGKDRAEEDQSLSESMQHMSFYYDPQLKRIVTHRQAKKEHAGKGQ